MDVFTEIQLGFNPKPVKHENGQPNIASVGPKLALNDYGWVSTIDTQTGRVRDTRKPSSMSGSTGVNPFLSD